MFCSGKKKKKTPVMFVANHTSWMDIPFVALAIGWRNYKIIAKQELLKVPLLSRSLRAGGHVILDRTNRRSQLNTYKQGVQWLKDGSNLVTFPEGTRSRTGVLGPFKKGAFKMAQAVNVPIVPLSIAHAHKIQPLDYIFPVRPGRSVPGSVTIGAPISTEGKTDDEVMEEVWNAIAANLPESQKPTPGTPFSVK
jgi:1-acyl-sn-glycerol-3-phosphate acyltransferase